MIRSSLLVWVMLIFLPGLCNGQPLPADSDSIDIQIAPNAIPPPASHPVQKSPATAFWRSILYPGLGQHYIDEHTKGYIFNGIQAALAVAIFYEHDRTNFYSDKVERVPQNDKQETYDTYQKHFNRRRNLIWMNVVFWLYNSADAYVNAHLLDFDRPVDLTSEIRLDPVDASPTYYLGFNYHFSEK